MTTGRPRSTSMTVTTSHRNAGVLEIRVMASSGADDQGEHQRQRGGGEGEGEAGAQRAPHGHEVRVARVEQRAPLRTVELAVAAELDQGEGDHAGR